MRDIIIDALIHAIKEILVFIFVTPFNLWVKACTKLAEQKRNKSLNLQGINSQWPFLTFLKRFNFDFYFDEQSSAYRILWKPTRCNSIV